MVIEVFISVQRDAVEERPHVAEVADRHAHLADLAAGQLVVGVVAGLGRQVEGDGQAGLALGQVAPVERVGLGCRGVPRVGAHHPRLVTWAADGDCSHCSVIWPGPPGCGGPSLLTGNYGRRGGGIWSVGSTTRMRFSRETRSSRTSWGLEVAQDQAAAGATGAPVGPDQHAQPGRVEHLHVAQVDEEVTGAVVEGRVHGDADVVDRGDVERPDRRTSFVPGAMLTTISTPPLRDRRVGGPVGCLIGKPKRIRHITPKHDGTTVPAAAGAATP